MKRSKPIRRALLLSILSILVCTAMLTGTTFAWFTDTSSTAVNTIQAGTLDIRLHDTEGTSLEGQTLAWQKATDHEDEPVLWEPGCTYMLQPIVIQNNGNLALKYKILITGIGGDAKLNEAIDWTILVCSNAALISDAQSVSLSTERHLLPGEFETLTICGHMREDAGNEYQGLSIDDISITVYATQDTVEYDSTTNEYDADANSSIITAKTVADPDWYQADASVLKIEDAADFVAFMETAYTWQVADRVNVPDFAGKTVLLCTDLYFSNGYIWTPISPYDSSYQSNGGFKGTFDGQGHVISGMNVTNNNATGRGYRLGLFGEVGNGAVFKNLVLDGFNTYAGNSSAGALCAMTIGDVTFENITVRNSTIRQGRFSGGIVGDIRTGTVTFKNCTVENSAIFNIHNNYCGALYGAKDSDATVTTDNCTVRNVVKHFFNEEGVQDWDTFQHITLEDALILYSDEQASFGGN